MAGKKKSEDVKVDTSAWKVITPAGEEIGDRSVSYRESNAIAESYRNTTGEFAQAVRV
jgi:hypothetical protein